MAKLKELNLKRIKENIKIDNNGCWIWQKCIAPTGYGNLRHKSKTYSVHHLIYSFMNGKIKKGMHVLHKCDTRSCCNPDHLFLGTNQDNIIDSMNKNRRKGITRNRPKMKYRPRSQIARGNSSKLSKYDKIVIKELIHAGISQAEISRSFNLSTVTVWRIT